MSRNHKFSRLWIALGALGVPAASTSAFGADFEIQTVRNAKFEEGQTFTKGDRLVLPNGASITLSDRTGPIVRSRTCIGPYDGAIDLCTKAMIGRNKAVSGAARGVGTENAK